MNTLISVPASMQRREPAAATSNLALECYLAAIKNSAHYAIELSPETTDPHRRYMLALASEVQEAGVGGLDESRATLRGLLRDYRDQAARYLHGLKEQLSTTADTLRQTIESLADCDGMHADKLKAAVGTLRELAANPEARALRVVIASAVDGIEESLAQLRKEHQFTMSQMQSEIQMLQRRVDSLENASAIDQATRFASRRSIEEYIPSISLPEFSILTMRIRGVAQARAKYGHPIADDLVATFARRLRNSISKEAVAGRWNDTDFVAIFPGVRNAEAPACKSIADHLSMPYACMLHGKAVRIVLEVSAEYLPGIEGIDPAHVVERLEAAFAKP